MRWRMILAKLDPALAGKKVFTVIWTTTPWTLPASMAVAFHPGEAYVALESSGEVYIVAEKLANLFSEKVGTRGARTRWHGFPAASSSIESFPIPFSTAPSLAFWPIT